MADAAGGCNSSGQEPPALAPSAVADAAPDPTPFVELRLFAEVFYDLQQNRIALGNRISAAERDGYIDVDPLLPVLDLARKNEDQAKLALKRCLRRVAPELREWAQDVPGIGEHLLALLLGATGHPLWAYPHRWEAAGEDRVLVAGVPFRRSLSQLRSYCGHGDAGRRRAKGMTADEAAALGNPRAKRALYLLAECCMKQTGSGRARRSPYRDVYDAAKAKAESDHPEWTDGHRHQHALRLTGKAIIADVWKVAHGPEQLLALDEEPAA